MDTLSNVASTASKIIWGEGNTTQANETAGQEPVSGQQGKGTATEPFDKGNSANPTDPTTTSNITSTPSSNPTTTSTMSDNTSAPPPNPVNAAAGGEIRPEENTDKTGVVPGVTGDGPKTTDINPSSSDPNPGAVPESGGVVKQKQQGGDRPLENPTEEKKEEEAEDFMKTRDPNDHSGEPMKMHDGNEIPATQAERRESKVGMPGGQAHGEEPKGTGEQHVKTTGMQADGGDFDATKPGAGREADRLLEEKGIKRDGDNHGAPAQTEQSTGGASSGGKEKEKEKTPLSEKIKTKLHIGSHKDK